MGVLLRLPPLITLVSVLAVAAYVIYHFVSTGTAQPLAIIALIVLCFGLVLRMRRKAQQERESD